MAKKTILVVGLAAALICGGAGEAGATLDLQGTRSIGMGGGLRATASGESAIFMNPAGLTLTKSYVLSALYQFRVSDEAHLFNVSVVDSLTTLIAAGVFYSYSHAEPSRHIAMSGGLNPFHLTETIQTHEAGLALGYNLSDFFLIGLNTRYVNITMDQPSDTPTDFVKESTHTGTMDVGAILRPWQGLHIAVVGHNLIPIEGVQFPMQLGMGIAYQFGTYLLAEFDAVLDFSTDETVAASFHGGAELFLKNMVAIRGGAAHNMIWEDTYVTAGLGIVTQKVAVDFGLRQMVEGGAETLIAFSLRFFMK